MQPVSEPDDQRRRNGEADRGKRRAEADIHRALEMVDQRGVKRGEPFGRQDENGDQHAAQRIRKREILDAEIDDHGEELRQQHDWHER